MMAMPPGHYHYAHRPRAPYPAGPSHMPPPYLPRGMPPFRHGKYVKNIIWLELQ